jgi:hypothetical protein
MTNPTYSIIICNFRWDNADGHHYCGEDQATKHTHICACCEDTPPNGDLTISDIPARLQAEINGHDETRKRRFEAQRERDEALARVEEWIARRRDKEVSDLLAEYKAMRAERDKAIREMQAGKTINVGHLLRLNTARDVIAQRDQRIAELEAALLKVRIITTSKGQGAFAMHEVVDAALSPAPAQPATATKECGACYDLLGGGKHSCAATPSPAALIADCIVCGYDESSHGDNPLIKHGFNPPPRYDDVFREGVERMNRHNDEEATFNAESDNSSNHPHVGHGAVWGCTCETEPQRDTVIRWNPHCELHGDAARKGMR